MTELEGCVLGVVWQRGPCTAYVVRQEFAISASSHWGASAGAIYPLLQRLEDAKLIRSRSHRWGTGKKKTFEITVRGIGALREWIGPPLEEWTAKTTFDPVRTRVTFLASLTPAARRKFVAEARKNLASEIARTRETLRRYPEDIDRFERLTTVAVLHELEARAKWLAEVEAVVR